MKYTIYGGCDTRLDPNLVQPYQDLDRGARRRRQPSPAVVAGDKENAAVAETKKQGDSHPKKKKNKTNRTKSKSAARKTKSSKPKRQSAAAAADRPALVEDDLASLEVPKMITVRPQSREVFSPIEDPESRPQRQYMLSEGPTMPSLRSLSPLRDDEEVPLASDDHNGNVPPAKSVTDSPIHSTKSIGGGQFFDDWEASNVKSSSSVLSTQRVTLRDVYDHQLQNATEFVNDVVKNKSDNDSVAAKESTENSVKEAEMKPEPEPGPCPDFNAILTELLRNNDGMISEDSMASQMNEIVASRLKQHPGYSPVDVEKYLSILCEQDKIMRCDGFIYSV